MSKLSFAKRYAMAALGAGYAFSVGLRDRRHRALINGMAKHFGYDDHPPRTLPVVELDRITNSRTAVRIAEGQAVNGNVSLYELLALARFVQERQPRTMFEIGTFDGRTTLNLALNASADAVTYTLDLPPNVPTRFEVTAADRTYVDKPASGQRFANTDIAPRIHQLYGDSASFDFSGYSADFVFVDGSHSYDFVMSDSHNALVLLGGRPGMVVWHDYGEWPDVTRALTELQRSDARFAGLTSIAGTSLVFLDYAGA